MLYPLSPTIRAKSKGTALITDASSSVGAIYADRLARRGHDLILVARDRHSVDAHAAFLRDDTGQSVQVIVANLEKRLGLSPGWNSLVNLQCAGPRLSGQFQR